MNVSFELLNEKKNQLLARGVSIMCDWYIDKAENATLWDMNGKKYTDFSGGIAVVNTGHRHPKVLEAVKNQLDKFTHTAFQVTPYANYIDLLDRLTKLAPIEGESKAVLFTTGAEAVENAVKIARCATGRNGIITFSGGFHGRTFMALAMTGKVAPYKDSFGQMPSGVYHAKYPVLSKGITVDDSLASIDDILNNDISPKDVAAIVIEPVQGEGGFNITPLDFMIKLRSLCDKHGILLIADEIQTGFARTGKMFAMEHFSPVKPDLMTVAKSLGGGFPISGIIGRRDIMDAPAPGGLGGTYAGNPLSIAASLAVLDVINDESLCTRSNDLGQQLKDLLNDLKNKNSFIKDVRGLGSMVAVEFETADQVKYIQQQAMEKGLLLLACGKDGNIMRFLYPLTIPFEQFSEALNILKYCIEDLNKFNYENSAQLATA